jgi:hypothetical protein
LVVSTAALLGSEDEEGRLCPAPSKESDQERGRAYEDFVKAQFNPGNPTPSGFAYNFTDPETGRSVSIDDCQQQTGALAEYKGPMYAKHLSDNDGVWNGNMRRRLILQAEKQNRARGNRPLIWFVAEKPLADWLERYFEAEKIPIVVDWLPMPGDSE